MFLVEYHNIFDKHRNDKVMNKEFKVKLTAKAEIAVNSKNLQILIHPKGDLIAELVRIHKHGVITALLFSKYASNTFAHKKPIGQLHPLVDFRQMHFQDSCTSTWTQLSRLTKNLNTWTILELQQQCHASYPQNHGRLQMYSQSRIATHERKVPFRSQTS